MDLAVAEALIADIHGLLDALELDPRRDVQRQSEVDPWWQHYLDHLAAGHADGPEHAVFAGALVDGEHRRGVADDVVVAERERVLVARVELAAEARARQQLRDPDRERGEERLVGLGVTVFPPLRIEFGPRRVDPPP